MRLAVPSLIVAATLTAACASRESANKPLHPAPATEPETAAQPSAPAPKGGFDGPHTRAVIVGVLQFDSRLSNFDPEHRKDEELARVLVNEQDVPEDQVALITDRAASREAVLESLRSAAIASEPGDLLLFYYAGHGIRDGKARTYFANYDIDPNAPRRTGISMDDLTDAMDGAPKGVKVLLLGDSCHSGALGEVAEALEVRGLSAAALTSAGAASQSTENWTFTQTVIDALSGDSLADRDGDGRIELGEAVLEVEDAMKYRERQRSGSRFAGLGADLEVAIAKPGPRFGEGHSATGVRVGEYGKVGWRWNREVVRVRQVADESFIARYFRYADAEDVPTPTSSLEPISFRTYAKDTPVLVYAEGGVHRAKVIETEREFLLVSYDGYGHVYDEWILGNRVIDAL